jgi:predicted ATPase/DNA-binding SARP family transcriptional activator
MMTNTVVRDINQFNFSVRLFGGLQIMVGTEPLKKTRSRRDALIIARLALAPAQTARRAALGRTLWPEPDHDPEQAARYLRRSLCELRKSLGEQSHRIRNSARDLTLDIDGAFVDVVEFDKAISAGTPDALSLAVSLYSGALLAEFDEPWIWEEREQRRQAYEAALHSLGATALAAGDLATAEAYLRRATALDPLREDSRRALMSLLREKNEHLAAITQYQEFCARLRETQRLVPSEAISALYREILNEGRKRRAAAPTPAVSALEAAQPHEGNVPASATGLIGREDDLARTAALLSRTRLLTLTGSGGVGKTRLAMQCAIDAGAHYPNGAWWVELAPLSTGSLLVEAVAGALGIREEENVPLHETLLAFLKRRSALLVLDNCEHVLDGCARLAEKILTACPDIRILATSREPLRIPGEAVYRVPSLAFPNGDSDSSTLAEIAATPSVRLFVERAAASLSTFALTADNATAIAEICRRLDGMPLSLELAAPFVASLTPDEIASQLDNRFRFLASGARTALPRHQSLAAVVAWSYDLLSPDEQCLFRRLSVFAGGWTLKAAEAVCGAPPLDPAAIVHVLRRLVDKSLVAADCRDGSMRYGYLETIRQFAAEQLVKAREAVELQTRHLEYYATWVENYRPAEREFDHWKRFEAEHDNTREALRSALVTDKNAEMGARLFIGLKPFLHSRGHGTEGCLWLEGILENLPVLEAITQAKVLAAGGSLAASQSDYRTAIRYYEQVSILTDLYGSAHP